MHQITVEEIAIEIARKPIKNLHLRVYPTEGRVCVTAPFFVSDRQIQKRLEKKMPWIKRKLAQFAHLPKPSPILMISGEVHHLLGKPYTLQVFEKERSPQTVTRSESTLSLCVKPLSTQDTRKKILDLFYKSEMSALLPALLGKWEPIVGVKITRCAIKSMKTRWGSCMIRDRRISLNLELMKRPLHCLEYVLVHELVHLHERLHNDRFWGLMDRFMPHWRQCREELNQSHLETGNCS
ncbi:MAG: M48 family metallopeptidase [Chlamydiales bacterium]